MSKKRKTEPPKASSNHLIPILLLALLAFGVYANSLSGGFVGDDEQQLLQNPIVSGHQFGGAFTSGVWAFRGFHGNYYRPLQFVVYALLHALFGFQSFGFHLAMVLLHVGNTLLAYLLAQRIVPRSRVAWAAAALFAIHPIHTETVDWVAALPDLMVTTIVLLALWFFARGGPVALHCALYAAALLTKETGVVLLPLYLGFERLVLARSWHEIRRSSTLYLALAGTLAGYLVLRWNALGGFAPGQQTFFHLSVLEFVLSALVIAGQYGVMLVFPLGLNYFHVFHPATAFTVGVLLSAVGLGVIAIFAVRSSTTAPVRYGLLWIALCLAPAMNLTGVGQNVFAERYLYLPSVGFVLIAGVAWEWCAARSPRPAVALGIAVLCAGAWQSVARNADWHDEFTLLRTTVAQSPDAGILHNNLAGSYVARNDLQHALEEERLAVRMEPRSAPFRKNLGLLLMARDPRAAIPELEEALRLQPDAADVKSLLEEARRMSAGR